LYARQIQKIMRYVGTSDADMEKGQMRFDLNISLRPVGQAEFGTRAEVKNLNSFKSLEKAFDYEFSRQKEILESGGKIVQETRGWDDEKEITSSQRSKEEAADYRYFPEPDIPPLLITREMVEKLRSEIPELPEIKASRYHSEFGLSAEDANNIASNLDWANYFEEAVQISNAPKKTANWFLNELLPFYKTSILSISLRDKFSPENLGKLVRMIEEGSVTGSLAKSQFLEIYSKNRDPEVYLAPFKVVEDIQELGKICQEVLDRNPQMVADFKGGKEKALGGLVGQVMAASKGAANPKSVNEVLRKLIG